MADLQPQPETLSTSAALPSRAEAPPESLARSEPEPGEVPSSVELPIGDTHPVTTASASFGRLFLILFVGCVIATLCMVPFSLHLLRQAQDQLPKELPLSVLLVVSAIVEVALSAALIAIGLAAGSRVELGVPLLRAWLGGDSGAARQVRSSLAPAFGAGLLLGLIVCGMAWGLDSEMTGKNARELVIPPAWQGLLASVGAGIREEIWLRLGVMTFVAWLGVLLLRPFTGSGRAASSPIAWFANVTAALLFAAIHIPQAQLLTDFSSRTLAFIMLGNGLPGIVFGWLYWRRGLVAAMVAHFGLDLILKVFMPLIFGSQP
jgi:membrane protease YdiL (CAAX protease family)